MSDRNKIVELLARSLASVEDSQLREVMQLVLIEQLQDYKCQEAFIQLVAPMAKEVLTSLLRDEEIKRLLADRVKSQLISMIGNMKIELPQPRGW